MVPIVSLADDAWYGTSTPGRIYSWSLYATHALPTHHAPSKRSIPRCVLSEILLIFGHDYVSLHHTSPSSSQKKTN